MWLSSDEALRRLNVKPQTLYASVSRGRIRAKVDPSDPRRSLYSGEDVDRLARRASGRARTQDMAVETMHWGEPVLSSSLSTIIRGRLYYRGEDAVALSAAGTLEEVAALLWGAFPGVDRDADPSEVTRGVGATIIALAERATDDATSVPGSPGLLREGAAAVLATIADRLTFPAPGPLHARLAARYRRPDAADDLRAALVLLADHELHASTFAARVTVSTGASLAAGALAGFAALSGPLHGRAYQAIAALADDLDATGLNPTEALRQWLGEGRAVPGFAHRLYPDGDIRAGALLDRLVVPRRYSRLAAAAETLLGERPNVDFALAAVAAAHNLPETAPMEVFALARSVGWLAHMLEQAESGSLIRPRARYTGPPPRVT